MSRSFYKEFQYSPVMHTRLSYLSPEEFSTNCAVLEINYSGSDSWSLNRHQLLNSAELHYFLDSRRRSLFWCGSHRDPPHHDSAQSTVLFPCVCVCVKPWLFLKWFFKDRISHLSWNSSSIPDWLISEPQRSICLHFPRAEIKACALMPNFCFLRRFWVLNSSLHAWWLRASSAELSPHPLIRL